MASNMESMLLCNDDESSDDAAGNPMSNQIPNKAPSYSVAPSQQSNYTAQLKSLYSSRKMAPTDVSAPPKQQTQPMQDVQQHNQATHSNNLTASQIMQAPSLASRQISSTQQRISGSSVHKDRPPDPFEPAPLTTVISRHTSVPVQTQPSSIPNAVPPQMTQSTLGSHRASNTQISSMHEQPSSTEHRVSSENQNITAARAKAEKDPTKTKEQFLMFTRVLMKYLEQKDLPMHARAKDVIRECAEKNKNKEKGYESVTASMRKRLRATIGEQYWTRAHSYLAHFQEMQRRKKVQQYQEQQKKQQELKKQQEQKQQAELKKKQLEAARKTQQEQSLLEKKKEEERKIEEARKSGLSKHQAKSKTKTGPLLKRNVSVQDASKKVQPSGPSLEYNELMETIDQSINNDWTKMGVLLEDSDFGIEQKMLLYGRLRPKISTLQIFRKGWNDRNLVSTRNAWAMVRLPELERDTKEITSEGTLVGGKGLPNHKKVIVESPWHNEIESEKDMTLAILSEATQIYTKQLLEKALHCAQQRENLEVRRLWHLQELGTKSILSVRLGCDVARQYACADGEAALIVKRMEETLQRNPNGKCNLQDNGVLSEARSMGDLACRPKLSAAIVTAAHNHAKRSFGISCGKDTELPFGRFLKQAKITAQDFHISKELSSHQSVQTLRFDFAR